MSKVTNGRCKVIDLDEATLRRVVEQVTRQVLHQMQEAQDETDGYHARLF